MRQLPGDHRPTGPQLCALLAEAGQCHQQLQHQPHLGHGSTRPARLSLGNPLAQPPGPWLLQPPPSSHLLLGALTPDGGEGAPGRALVPTSPPNKSQSLARPCRWFFGAGWHGACPRPLWTSAFLAVKWVFPVVSGGRCGRVSEACCGRASDLHCPPPPSQARHISPQGNHLSFILGERLAWLTSQPGSCSRTPGACASVLQRSPPLQFLFQLCCQICQLWGWGGWEVTEASGARVAGLSLVHAVPPTPHPPTTPCRICGAP